MMTESAIKILEMLCNNEYVTAKNLADRLECSTKTIRTRIRELNDELSQVNNYRLSVESKPRYGFRIIKEENVTFEEIKSKMCCKTHRDLPTTVGERVDFLLFYLLERSEYITISNLADELYVSDSSIKTSLKSVEDILGTYKILIERRPGYGIKVQGTEKNIRNCFVNLVIEEASYANVFFYNLDYEIAKMAEIVLKLMKEYTISLSELAFYSFIKYICISIKRIQEGHIIEHCENDKIKIDISNQKLVDKLSDIIKDEYNIILNEEEEYYMEVQLAGNRIINNIEKMNLVYREEINSIVDEMLDIIKSEFNIDFTSNFDLIMHLNQHMIPFDIRLKYDIKLENPILDEIKDNYPFAFNIARRTAVILEEYYNKKVSEDELGYLAVIWELGLEKQEPEVKPSNILIVCSSGRGSSKLLSYKYRQQFGKYLNDIKTCDMFEVDHMDFDNIDYVFTTVPISKRVPVPVYEVGMFLDKNDIVNVRNVLKKNSSSLIKKYFDDRLFFADVEADTKEEVIHFLCEQIGKYERLPEGFEESVLHREQLSTTDYGNMVAIPHPYISTGDKTVMAVCLLKNPVYWGRNMVSAVFLISVGQFEDPDLQKFYQKLMKVLMDKEWVENLVENKKMPVDFK